MNSMRLMVKRLLKFEANNQIIHLLMMGV